MEKVTQSIIYTMLDATIRAPRVNYSWCLESGAGAMD